MNKLQTVDYKTIEKIETSWDYNQVVLSMVDSVIYRLNEAIDCKQVEDKEGLEELLNDSILHETIDGSEYIIYNCYHLPIIQFSDNEDYYIDNFGSESLEHSLKEGGLSGLHCAIAFYALYADVSERMYEILNDYESE